MLSEAPVDEFTNVNPRLESLLDTLLPGDQTLGLPSASAAGVMSFLQSENKLSLFDEYLVLLETVAQQKYHTSWHALDNLALLTCVELSSRSHWSLASQVLGQVLRGYYSARIVLNQLHAGAVPPFPQGNRLPENNWDLLESVFERGPIYRTV